jgi:murein DD-endopeptidase / murein LD-carboxypeptidase
MIQRLFIIILLQVLSLTAQGQNAGSFILNKDWIGEQERCYYMQCMGFELPLVYNKNLYDTVESWLGTPYRFAGSTKSGTDCSGFVNTVYHGVYKTNLGARNSGDIYKKITKIDKDELTEGDLVFFRIRKKRISHVGVYLGNNKFVHASTSSGVIISDLTEPYYKKYYAGGGRLPSTSITDTDQK